MDTNQFIKKLSYGDRVRYLLSQTKTYSNNWQGYQFKNVWNYDPEEVME